jgi:hypothetical protein
MSSAKLWRRQTSPIAQRASLEAAQASQAPRPGRLPAFRHFIATPTNVQRFTLDGVRFNPADTRQWERAEKVMATLAHLIRFNPDPNKEKPNGNLPSGYTYFLQLVAHDLVHSSLSTSLGEGRVFGLGNVRHAPLRLETVYGGGPTECPHAYRTDATNFRKSLRLGKSRLKADDPDHLGPEKDIARGATGSVTDLSKNVRYTEALIADPRNDSHAIISQTLVFFHELHNRIVSGLEKVAQLHPGANPFADAQRVFVAAQTACILIYRSLIRQDLLPRILHRAVWEAYEKPPRKKPFQLLAGGEWRPPLEFVNGAFRFGHSMVRPSYRFNESAPEAFKIEQIVKRTSQGAPSDVPLEKDWLVDWERFFDPDPDMGNFSVRIGPWSQVGIGEDVPGEGNLIVRDLLSSIAVQPWSIGHLVDRLRDTHASLLDASEFLRQTAGSSSRPWAASIGAWLRDRSQATFGDKFKLDANEVLHLADDPPIPFFVRFEAGLDSGNAGERLGILGSIIVADVIYGVLEQDSLLGKDQPEELQEQLAVLSSEILPDTQGAGTNIFAFLTSIEGPDRKVSLASVRRFLAT